MRLIDANDILDSIENWKRIVLYYHPCTKKFTTIPLSEVLAFLEDAPTIDAVPVVRCKDCRHFDGQELCLKHWFFVGLDLTFFCKSGERKDDESHPFADDVMMGERKE